MEGNRLYDAISRCAWGYVLIYFDINLGTVSVLPDFAGFLLFLQAIDLLREEERELELLRPLGIFLAVWNGFLWVATIFGWNPGTWTSWVGTVSVIANLYFHFQLLTNLSSIAGKYQPEGGDYDIRLLRYRTGQTVLFTVMRLLGELSLLFGDVWRYLSMGLGLVYLIFGLCVMSLLFQFRKELAGA